MKKNILMLLVLLVLVLNVPLTTIPVQANGTESEYIDMSEGDIHLFADVIVKKTRMYKGKLQYRHWNETRGYWIEKKWINV